VTWRSGARRGGRRAWEFTRSSGAWVQRVVSQKAADARQAGAQLARRVIGIQQSATLDRKLMLRSAELTLGDREGTEPNPAWQQGYASVAVPALRELQASQAGQEPRGPERPSWPSGPAIGPEPEDPEAGQ
jgi:hypothetical protein